MTMKYKQVHPTQNHPQSRLGDERGINLREHFAGLALQGLSAAYFNTVKDQRQVATLAVELADALCEELGK